MAVTIQGSEIELLVRAKNSGDFKQMVCEKTVKLDVTNDVTTEKTKCGVYKGIQVADFKLDGSAVFNVEPSNSEVSYDQVLTWQLARTKCEFILRNVATTLDGTAYAAGEAIRMSGDCYFVNTSFTGDDGVNAGFTWAMEGSGTLNETES